MKFQQLQQISDMQNYNLHYHVKKICNIMKLSFFFILLVFVQASATSFSQTINLDVNNTEIRQVIKDIEQQTDYRFFYTDGLADLARKVSLKIKGEDINNVLSELFDNTQLGYRIADNKLVMLAPKGAMQQGRTITGVITDDTGEPLPGANIVVKGSSTGVMTDMNGAYSLVVPNDNVTLVFSYMGYVSKEIVVGSQTTISVTLNENVTLIDEVVVVGYGQQKRVSLTGSVSQVSGDKITERPSTSVTNTLQGMMPGVTVIRSSGQPGDETSGLRIRGFSSVSDVSAMILIDGVEGSLEYVNPDDIESISVLKDATTAAIYGARAAGGVVLVTTKKGSVQKVTIRYNGSFGISVPGIMPQRLPPWEEQQHILDSRYAALNVIEFPEDFSEWLANPNYMRDIHPSAINRYQSALGNSNWLVEGLREYTTSQRHSVSLNGGHGKTTYFLSGGYQTQNGLFKYGPDSNDRYNMRVNLNTEVNKYIDLKVSSSIENNKRNRNSSSHESIMEGLYTARGRENMYLPEDDVNYAKDPYSSDLYANPIRSMRYGGSDITQNNFVTALGNIHIKNLVEGLTIDLNASRRFGTYKREIDRVFLAGQGRNGPRGDYNTHSPNSSVQKYKNDNFQDKFEGLVNYKTNFGKHSLGVLAGASYEHWMRDQIDVRANDLLSDELFSFKYYDSSLASNSILTDEVLEWKMASLFGRINYDYANRYLLELVMRYDGSSRLAPGSRFEFFPAASAGWVVSEESFFEGAKGIVNFMKLRGSFGRVGNSTAISGDYYPYLGTIYRGTDMYMGERYYYKQKMTSADITWETVQTTNIAADFSFLNSRLSLTGEYFWKKNLNMLSPLEPGNIVGIEVLPRENVGTMKAWGWELSLGWRDKIGDLSYNVAFNIDDSDNKLVEYKGVNAIASGNVHLLEGYPMFSLWGYQTDGFWNSRDEYLAYKEANPGYESFGNQEARISGGDTRYVAQGKADHKVGTTGSGTPEDPGDLIYLGDANPHYAYGLNIGVQWKGFDFSLFFQGVGKRKFFIRSQHLTPMGSSGQMPWTINRDYWREDNKDAYFARLFESGAHNYEYADRWVQDGSYIRLKNIQLGYTLPIKKYIQSCRVYITGNDVWEHTNMLSAWDPEFGNNTATRTGTTNINDRVGRSYYPFMRSWTAGINLSF